MHAKADLQNMGISVMFSQLGFGFPRLGFSGYEKFWPWGLGGIWEKWMKEIWGFAVV